MGNSLQDQFLKMGLIDKKKYNDTKKKRHQKKKDPNAKGNEIAEIAKQALAEKKQRDLQLNKKKRAERQAKEATAQARQLIERHRIEFEKGNVAYNFKHENKIKKVYLSEKAIDSIVQGKNGIVKLAGEYQYVPADIIYKVRELNRKLVVLLNTPTDKKTKDENDPYADYEIPDDLMW